MSDALLPDSGPQTLCEWIDFLKSVERLFERLSPPRFYHKGELEEEDNETIQNIQKMHLIALEGAKWHVITQALLCTFPSLWHKWQKEDEGLMKEMFLFMTYSKLKISLERYVEGLWRDTEPGIPNVLHGEVMVYLYDMFINSELWKRVFNICFDAKENEYMVLECPR